MLEVATRKKTFRLIMKKSALGNRPLTFDKLLSQNIDIVPPMNLWNGWLLQTRLNVADDHMLSLQEKGAVSEAKTDKKENKV